MAKGLPLGRGIDSPAEAAAAGMWVQTCSQLAETVTYSLFKEAAGEVDWERWPQQHWVVAPGLKFLWFTHPCFPATQKGSAPPGLPFFQESSSPGELCGTADPSAEDWGSGTFCEGALLSPICMKWVQSSLCEDLEPTRCL